MKSGRALVPTVPRIETVASGKRGKESSKLSHEVALKTITGEAHVIAPTGKVFIERRIHQACSEAAASQKKY